MPLQTKLEDAVTGQPEFVLVPRVPTKEMLQSAWAEALAEDAAGVWSAMIERYEESTSIKENQVLTKAGCPSS